jgi:hypothetical protein
MTARMRPHGVCHCQARLITHKLLVIDTCHVPCRWITPRPTW